MKFEADEVESIIFMLLWLLTPARKELLCRSVQSLSLQVLKDSLAEAEAEARLYVPVSRYQLHGTEMQLQQDCRSFLIPDYGSLDHSHTKCV